MDFTLLYNNCKALGIELGEKGIVTGDVANQVALEAKSKYQFNQISLVYSENKDMAKRIADLLPGNVNVCHSQTCLDQFSGKNALIYMDYIGSDNLQRLRGLKETMTIKGVTPKAFIATVCDDHGITDDIPVGMAFCIGSIETIKKGIAAAPGASKLHETTGTITGAEDGSIEKAGTGKPETHTSDGPTGERAEDLGDSKGAGGGESAGDHEVRDSGDGPVDEQVGAGDNGEGGETAEGSGAGSSDDLVKVDGQESGGPGSDGEEQPAGVDAGADTPGTESESGSDEGASTDVEGGAGQESGDEPAGTDGGSDSDNGDAGSEVDGSRRGDGAEHGSDASGGDSPESGGDGSEGSEGSSGEEAGYGGAGSIEDGGETPSEDQASPESDKQEDWG